MLKVGSRNKFFHKNNSLIILNPLGLIFTPKNVLFFLTIANNKMRRNYKPKVKLYTELLIESAINEVGKGATTPATAKKYYMSTSLLWWRIMESKGLMTREQQVAFQSDVCFLFLKLY